MLAGRKYLIFLVALLACAPGSPAALQRVPNTSLNLPPSPPVFNYTWTNAFPPLTFSNPVCMTSPPGETKRLFILEKRGRIVVITNLANPTRTIFMEMASKVTTTDVVSNERGLLGMAFHPGYATNRYFYLYYTGTITTGAGTGVHDIVARFETSPANSNQASAATETLLIAQFDDLDNHNGGDLHFGPDGYLYVSLGDEGGANDTGRNSQRIDKDFFSAIMRIDVDKRPANLAPNPHPAVTANYSVPADNPFVGATTFNGLAVNPSQVRTEFWAVGLRNPWRICFDPVTGILYCADVGQSTREEVDVIAKGGNYGWSYWEGFFQRTNSALIPAGFLHSPPIVDYPRSLGYSITGGRVYRGTRISQLIGAYIYGDYGSGRIWALRHNGNTVTQNTVLFSNPLGGPFNAGGISAFGIDPSNSDILYADLLNGNNSLIKRVVYSSTYTGTPIPPTLAETGAFTNLAILSAEPGIVGYDLNLPFWSDGATKTRWFSLPDTNRFMTFSPESNWTFPTGVVWIQHFELELTNGVPESARRLETRFLVYNTNGGYGVTYRWGASLTNAELVSEAGLDEEFIIRNFNGTPIRTQVWHYPSRVECLQCHNTSSSFALGFTTAQLNRDYDHGGTLTNQIAALADASYFNNTISNRHLFKALAHPTNQLVSLEYRARSWLQANCANCHRPNGVQMSLWDARSTTPTEQAGIVNGALVDDGDNPANKVIVPGSTSLSVLVQRIATTGEGRMPPIGPSLVDTQAVALLSAWITDDLPSFSTFAQWQIAHFGATNAPNAAAQDDPDQDLSPNRLEYLTGTDPHSAGSRWQPAITKTEDLGVISFPQIANRAFEVQSSPTLLSPDWSPVNVPENAPFFPASNRLWSVPQSLTDTNRFYRVRVYAP